MVAIFNVPLNGSPNRLEMVSAFSLPVTIANVLNQFKGTSTFSDEYKCLKTYDFSEKILKLN